MIVVCKLLFHKCCINYTVRAWWQRSLHKEIVLERKRVKSAGKVIEEDFEVEAAVTRESPSVPFAIQSPCSFCHDNETLPGESLRRDEATTSFT